MLRITTNETKDSLLVQLEGKLAGPWVDELERCLGYCNMHDDARTVCLDLAGLTFVDDRGKALLRDIRRRGAQFVATDCCMRAMVAELADRSTK